ncbi:MAG: hypothetical protein F6K63_29875 [Moorea sp. SIO1G6]|uniref:hypothetical protein n=1 Tax=Moorena sp. SIO1G6 TaxID=2607840 RepID=UPI0013BF3AA6|nr:hypothetical protein [Moorena sp. SIO1G6]NET68379.1 hypothetical protein [Moorena sp. SIO1G6]
MMKAMLSKILAFLDNMEYDYDIEVKTVETGKCPYGIYEEDSIDIPVEFRVFPVDDPSNAKVFIKGEAEAVEEEFRTRLYPNCGDKKGEKITQQFLKEKWYQS